MSGFRLMLLCGAALAAVEASPAFAADAAAAAADSGSSTIGELVVTAERREQTLQSYAGVAQTISGTQLESEGVKRIEDLQVAVPGLSISNQEGNVQVYIRGVGTSNNTELGDPSAATHFDDVYLPRPRGVGGLFFDLDRVEVDVGPQGTLRGRNAVAGTLNIIPKSPLLGQLGGYAQVEGGLYDQHGYEAALNVPIGQVQALRLSVWSDSHGTAYKNAGLDQGLKPTGIEDDFSGRISYLFQPNDRFRAIVVADYEKEHGTGYPSTNIRNALVGGKTPDDFSLRDILYQGPQGDEHNEGWGVLGKFSYDFGPAVLEYDASHRHLNFTQTNASNQGVVRPGFGPNDVDYDNFSSVYWLTRSTSNVHELRLTSPAESKVKWTAGAFYFEEFQEVGFFSVNDKGLFFSGTEFTMPSVKSKSFAEYADITYPVTDSFRVKAGYRHTSETKSRFGVGGNWTLGLGSAGFNCCFVTRLGTPGFQPIFTGRANFIAPTNPAQTAAYFMQAIRPGSRDTIFQQIAGIADGSRPNGTCIDTPDTDPTGTQTCPANGQFSFLTLTGPIQQQGFYHGDFDDWRAGFEYDVRPNSLVYGTVSTGHKSGGFNDTIVVGGVAQAPTFQPEQVILYELGTKNTVTLGGRRAMLNADVFWYDYSNQVFQTLVAIGGTSTAAGFSQQNVNVAQSTIKGFEAEGDFDLPARLNLDLIFSYLDAHANSGSLFDTRANDFAAETPNFKINIGGNELPLVSKINFNAHLTQTFDLFGGRADWQVLANYRSAYFLNIYNELPVVQFANTSGAGFTAFSNSVAGTTINARSAPSSPFLHVTDARQGGFWGRQPGYVTVNAGVGWQPLNGAWRVEAYVSNLFNKTVVEKQIVSDVNTNILFLNQARQAGVRLRVNF